MTIQMLKKNHLFLFLTALCLSFSACNRDGVLSEMNSNDTNPEIALEAEGATGDDNPCEGSYSIAASVEVLDAATHPEYAAYDLAVMVELAPPPPPTFGCATNCEACAYVNFPAGFAISASITFPNNSPASTWPVYQLVPITPTNGIGSYVGYTSTDGAAAAPDPLDSYTHYLCTSTAPFILLFDLPDGYNPADAIITGSGICIIDNLPDPKG